MGFTWAAIGISSSPAAVRDLWRHEDLAAGPGGYEGPVPGHGVVLLRVR
jgi:hypothetical protein